MSGIVIDIEARVDKAQESLSRLEHTTREIQQNAVKTQEGLKKLRPDKGQIDDTAKLARTVGDINTQVKSTADSFKSMGRAVMNTAVLGGLSAGLISVDNTFAGIEGKIRLAEKATSDFKTTMDGLQQVSTETRSSFALTADLFSKVSVSTASIATATDSAVMRAVKSIQMAGVIAGGSADSFKAAMIQLGQGLGAGALRGEEFNSVMEQALPLAQAMADHLQISVGQLRLMANEGQLTSDVVFGALLSQSKALEEKFKKMPLTLSQGLVRVKEEFLLVADILNKKFKISSALGGPLASLANGLSKLSTQLPYLIADTKIFWYSWSGRLSNAFYPFIHAAKLAMNTVRFLLESSGIAKFAMNVWTDFSAGGTAAVRRVFIELETLGKSLKLLESGDPLGAFRSAAMSIFTFLHLDVIEAVEGVFQTFHHLQNKALVVLDAIATGFKVLVSKVIATKLSNIIDWVEAFSLRSLKALIIDKTLKPLLGDVKTLLHNLQYSEFDFLTVPLTLLGEGLVKLFGRDVVDAFLAFTKKLPNITFLVETVVGLLVPQLKIAMSAISILTAAGKGISISLNANLFSAGAEQVRKIVQKLLVVFKSLKTAAAVKLKLIFDFDMVGAVKEKLQEIRNTLSRNLFSGETFTAGAKAFTDLISGIYSKSLGLQKAFKAVSDFGAAVIEVFREVWDAVIGHSWWTDTIESVERTSEGLSKTALDSVKRFAKKVIEAFRGVYVRVKDTLNDLSRWAFSFKDVAIDFKADSLDSFISKIEDKFGGLKRTAAEWFDIITTKDGLAGLRSDGTEERMAALWENIKTKSSALLGNIQIAIDVSPLKAIFTDLRNHLDKSFQKLGTGISDQAPAFADAFLKTAGALISARFLPKGMIKTALVAQMSIAATAAWAHFLAIWNTTTTSTSLGVNIGHLVGASLGALLSTFTTHLPAALRFIAGAVGGFARGLVESLFPPLKHLFSFLDTMGLGTASGVLLTFLFGRSTFTFFKAITSALSSTEGLTKAIKNIRTFFNGTLAIPSTGATAWTQASRYFFGNARRAMSLGAVGLVASMLGIFDDVFASSPIASAISTMLFATFAVSGEGAFKKIAVLWEELILGLALELEAAGHVGLADGLLDWLIPTPGTTFTAKLAALGVTIAEKVGEFRLGVLSRVTALGRVGTGIGSDLIFGMGVGVNPKLIAVADAIDIISLAVTKFFRASLGIDALAASGGGTGLMGRALFGTGGLAKMLLAVGLLAAATGASAGTVGDMLPKEGIFGLENVAATLRKFGGAFIGLTDANADRAANSMYLFADSVSSLKTALFDLNFDNIFGLGGNVIAAGWGLVVDQLERLPEVLNNFTTGYGDLIGEIFEPETLRQMSDEWLLFSGILSTATMAVVAGYVIDLGAQSKLVLSVLGGEATKFSMGWREIFSDLTFIPKYLKYVFVDSSIRSFTNAVQYLSDAFSKDLIPSLRRAKSEFMWLLQETRDKIKISVGISQKSIELLKFIPSALGIITGQLLKIVGTAGWAAIKGSMAVSTGYLVYKVAYEYPKERLSHGKHLKLNDDERGILQNAQAEALGVGLVMVAIKKVLIPASLLIVPYWKQILQTTWEMGKLVVEAFVAIFKATATGTRPVLTNVFTNLRTLLKTLFLGMSSGLNFVIRVSTVIGIGYYKRSQEEGRKSGESFLAGLSDAFVKGGGAIAVGITAVFAGLRQLLYPATMGLFQTLMIQPVKLLGGLMPMIFGFGKQAFAYLTGGFVAGSILEKPEWAEAIGTVFMFASMFMFKSFDAAIKNFFTVTLGRFAALKGGLIGIFLTLGTILISNMAGVTTWADGFLGSLEKIWKKLKEIAGFKEEPVDTTTGLTQRTVERADAIGVRTTAKMSSVSKDFADKERYDDFMKMKDEYSDAVNDAYIARRAASPDAGDKLKIAEETLEKLEHAYRLAVKSSKVKVGSAEAEVKLREAALLGNTSTRFKVETGQTYKGLPDIKADSFLGMTDALLQATPYLPYTQSVETPLNIGEGNPYSTSNILDKLKLTRGTDFPDSPLGIEAAKQMTEVLRDLNELRILRDVRENLVPMDAKAYRDELGIVQTTGKETLGQHAIDTNKRHIDERVASILANQKSVDLNLSQFAKLENLRKQQQSQSTADRSFGNRIFTGTGQRIPKGFDIESSAASKLEELSGAGNALTSADKLISPMALATTKTAVQEYAKAFVKSVAPPEASPKKTIAEMTDVAGFSTDLLRTLPEDVAESLLKSLRQVELAKTVKELAPAGLASAATLKDVIIEPVGTQAYTAALENINSLDRTLADFNTIRKMDIREQQAGIAKRAAMALPKEAASVSAAAAGLDIDLSKRDGFTDVEIEGVGRQIQQLTFLKEIYKDSAPLVSQYDREIKNLVESISGLEAQPLADMLSGLVSSDLRSFSSEQLQKLSAEAATIARVRKQIANKVTAGTATLDDQIAANTTISKSTATVKGIDTKASLNSVVGLRQAFSGVSASGVPAAVLQSYADLKGRIAEITRESEEAFGEGAMDRFIDSENSLAKLNDELDRTAVQLKSIAENRTAAFSSMGLTSPGQIALVGDISGAEELQRYISDNESVVRSRTASEQERRAAEKNIADAQKQLDMLGVTADRTAQGVLGKLSSINTRYITQKFIDVFVDLQNRLEVANANLKYAPQGEALGLIRQRDAIQLQLDKLQSRYAALTDNFSTKFSGIGEAFGTSISEVDFFKLSDNLQAALLNTATNFKLAMEDALRSGKITDGLKNMYRVKEELARKMQLITLEVDITKAKDEAARTGPKAAFEKVNSVLGESGIDYKGFLELSRGDRQSLTDRAYATEMLDRIAQDSKKLNLPDKALQALEGWAPGNESETLTAFKEALGGTEDSFNKLFGDSSAKLLATANEQITELKNNTAATIDNTAARLGKTPTGGAKLSKVELAQASLESDWGRSKNAKESNVFFGMTKGNWKGPLSATGKYRAYPTPAAAAEDYRHGINHWDTYKNARGLQESNPRAYIEAIKKAGYAEDPDYVQKVMSRMNHPNLERWGAETFGTAFQAGIAAATAQPVQMEIAPVIDIPDVSVATMPKVAAVGQSVSDKLFKTADKVKSTSPLTSQQVLAASGGRHVVEEFGGLSAHTANIFTPEQLTKASKISIALKDEKNKLALAGPNADVREIQANIDRLTHDLVDMGDAAEEAAVAVREAGKSFASGIKSGFTDALKGLLHGEKDEGKGVFATFAGKLKQSLIDNTISSFSEGVTNSLGFGKGGGIERIASGLGGSIFDLLDKGLSKVSPSSVSSKGGIFGGLANLLGFASGGQVSGPGTGTSDSIPAMLSNGEFVVNAKATASNIGLLHAINKGNVSKFASGGLVGVANAFSNRPAQQVGQTFVQNITPQFSEINTVKLDKSAKYLRDSAFDLSDAAADGVSTWSLLANWLGSNKGNSGFVDLAESAKGFITTGAKWAWSKAVELGDTVATALTNIGSITLDYGQKAVTWSIDAAKAASTTLANIGEVAIDYGQKALTWAAENLTTTLSNVGSVAIDYGNKAISWAINATKAASTTLTNVGSVAIDYGNKALTWAAENLTATLSNVGSVAIDYGNKALTWAAENLTATLSNVGSVAIDYGNKAISWAINATKAASTTLTNVGSIAVDYGGKALTWSADNLTSIGDSLAKFFIGTPAGGTKSKPIAAIPGLLDNLAEKITSGWDVVVGAGKGSTTKVVEMATTLAGSVGKWFGQISLPTIGSSTWSTIINAAGSLKDKVGDWLSSIDFGKFSLAGVGTSIVDGVSGIFRGIAQWFNKGGKVGGDGKGVSSLFTKTGHVKGPGTGRSDDVFSMLSNGEYVMTAEATKKHQPLFDAINAGKDPLEAYQGMQYVPGSNYTKDVPADAKIEYNGKKISPKLFNNMEIPAGEKGGKLYRKSDGSYGWDKTGLMPDTSAFTQAPGKEITGLKGSPLIRLPLLNGIEKSGYDFNAFDGFISILDPASLDARFKGLPSLIQRRNLQIADIRRGQGRAGDAAVDTLHIVPLVGNTVNKLPGVHIDDNPYLGGYVSSYSQYLSMPKAIFDSRFDKITGSLNMGMYNGTVLLDKDMGAAPKPNAQTFTLKEPIKTAGMPDFSKYKSFGINGVEIDPVRLAEFVKSHTDFSWMTSGDTLTAVQNGVSDYTLNWSGQTQGGWPLSIPIDFPSKIGNATEGFTFSGDLQPNGLAPAMPSAAAINKAAGDLKKGLSSGKTPLTSITGASPTLDFLLSNPLDSGEPIEWVSSAAGESYARSFEEFKKIPMVSSTDPGIELGAITVYGDSETSWWDDVLEGLQNGWADIEQSSVYRFASENLQWIKQKAAEVYGDLTKVFVGDLGDDRAKATVAQFANLDVGRDFVYEDGAATFLDTSGEYWTSDSLFSHTKDYVSQVYDALQGNLYNSITSSHMYYKDWKDDITVDSKGVLHGGAPVIEQQQHSSILHELFGWTGLTSAPVSSEFDDLADWSKKHPGWSPGDLKPKEWNLWDDGIKFSPGLTPGNLGFTSSINTAFDANFNPTGPASSYVSPPWPTHSAPSNGAVPVGLTIGPSGISGGGGVEEIIAAWNTLASTGKGIWDFFTDNPVAAAAGDLLTGNSVVLHSPGSAYNPKAEEQYLALAADAIKYDPAAALVESSAAPSATPSVATSKSPNGVVDIKSLTPEVTKILDAVSSGGWLTRKEIFDLGGATEMGTKLGIPEFGDVIRAIPRTDDGSVISASDKIFDSYREYLTSSSGGVLKPSGGMSPVTPPVTLDLFGQTFTAPEFVPDKALVDLILSDNILSAAEINSYGFEKAKKELYPDDSAYLYRSYFTTDTAAGRARPASSDALLAYINGIRLRALSSGTAVRKPLVTPVTPIARELVPDFGRYTKDVNGNLIKKATGGYISGPGTGTSDSIPAMLSNGEYVINASATARNRALLEAINSGRPISDMASPMMSTPIPYKAANDSTVVTNNSTINMNITGDISRQTRAEISQMIPQIAMGVNQYNRQRG